MTIQNVRIFGVSRFFKTTKQELNGDKWKMYLCGCGWGVLNAITVLFDRLSFGVLIRMLVVILVSASSFFILFYYFFIIFFFFKKQTKQKKLHFRGELSCTAGQVCVAPALPLTGSCIYITNIPVSQSAAVQNNAGWLQRSCHDVPKEPLSPWCTLPDKPKQFRHNGEYSTVSDGEYQRAGYR